MGDERDLSREDPGRGKDAVVIPAIATGPGPGSPDPTGTNLLLGAPVRLVYGGGTVPRERLSA
jgi:hypothetical protein